MGLDQIDSYEKKGIQPSKTSIYLEDEDEKMTTSQAHIDKEELFSS